MFYVFREVLLKTRQETETVRASRKDDNFGYLDFTLWPQMLVSHSQQDNGDHYLLLVVRKCPPVHILRRPRERTMTATVLGHCWHPSIAGWNALSPLSPPPFPAGVVRISQAEYLPGRIMDGWQEAGVWYDELVNEGRTIVKNSQLYFSFTHSVIHSFSYPSSSSSPEEVKRLPKNTRWQSAKGLRSW